MQINDCANQAGRVLPAKLITVFYYGKILIRLRAGWFSQIWISSCIYFGIFTSSCRSESVNEACEFIASPMKTHSPVKFGVLFALQAWEFPETRKAARVFHL
jgi:hypothetical protein